MKRIPAKLPPAPATLGTPGKKLWKEVVEGFELEPHQFQTLHMACYWLDSFIAHVNVLKKKGRTYTDRFGQPKLRPEVKAAMEASQEYRLQMRELGFDVLAPGEAPRGPRLAGTMGA